MSQTHNGQENEQAAADALENSEVSGEPETTENLAEGGDDTSPENTPPVTVEQSRPSNILDKVVAPFSRFTAKFRKQSDFEDAETPAQPPKIEDFEGRELDFVKAHIAFLFQEERKKTEDLVHNVRNDVTGLSEEVSQAYQSHQMQEARSHYSDFDEVIKKAGDLSIPHDVALFIKSSPNCADIMYALAQDPTKAANIMRQPTEQILYALGGLKHPSGTPAFNALQEQKNIPSPLPNPIQTANGKRKNSGGTSFAEMSFEAAREALANDNRDIH